MSVQKHETRGRHPAEQFNNNSRVVIVHTVLSRKPKPSGAIDVLRAAVATRAEEPDALTATHALEAWFEFGEREFRVPASDDADGMLYQFGTYAFSGQPRFHLDLTRQFAVARSEEFLQVRLDMQFAPDDDLHALGSFSQWWWRDGGQPLSAWAESIRRRGEWQLLTTRTPVAVHLHADET